MTIDTGDNNSGDRNTGTGNTGDWNSGTGNTGDNNSGDWNTGTWNSGNKNSGDRNTGNSNSGDWNSGNSNSGNKNTGTWNSGNKNTGFCNTDTPCKHMFNKEVTERQLKLVIFPDFFYFHLVEWICSARMSDAEKAAHPKHTTVDGYLKTYGYKEAFINSWNNAGIRDRKLVLELPNFDNEIFKETSGIDVYQELKIGEEEC